MNGAMKSIREMYHVPAKRGGRVIFDGRPGVITGTIHAHLRVRLDDGQRVILHPTWRVEYL
jgi:hypothetical protein